LKKKKIIVINNTELRLFRNNLRIILVLWANSEWEQFFSKQVEIRERICTSNRDKLKEKSLHELKKISAVLKQNRNIFNNSICICPFCKRIDQNMTYNLIDRKWYCIDCYCQMQRTMEDEKMESRFP